MAKAKINRNVEGMETPKKLSSKGPYKRLLKYLGKYKGRLIVAILFIFCACLLFALAPLFLGYAIDNLGKLISDGYNEEIYNSFGFYLILMVACYICHSAFSLTANLMIISAQQNAIYDIRKQIDQKISRLPLNYYDTTTYGDILARLTNDVEIVSQAFQQCIYQVIKACFIIVIVLVMMLYVSGWLTLVGLISIPILLILAGRITEHSKGHFTKEMDTVGKLNGFVEEYYTGHNIVTLFNKQKVVDDKFQKINFDLYDNAYKGRFLSSLLYPLTMGANNIGYALVCFVGALMAIAGGLSIGMIQTFVQYLSQFSTPINTIMSLVSIMQKTGASATRIFEFLDEEEEVPETDNPQFPEPLRGSVQFEHVRFGYLPHQTLITDLNINIGAGEKTAIVGPTGAGKTTFVNLIMRFYDVKGGSIKIDGIDIRDMARADLRRIFGMVLQETWLYSGSIKDNIRYGKPDATDEEVIAAAKAAHCDAFIETLPGTYDFILNEGASNIAQGQRQLLTIARAMLSNPPIMILDEATSSVDTRTEGLIQEAMQNMMKGRTSFVIAHRLSTITDAQNILYMQDGDILEVGTHDELMAKDGLYAKLYNSQFADSQ